MSVAASAADLPPKEQFHLFLLVGQSNMAGRGEVSDEDRTPHARVLMLSKEGEWVPAVDPLHFDKPGIAGTGLGKSFAIEIAEANPKITVGLIPCAVGGSPITAWEPDAYYEPTKSHPWDDAVRRAKLALESGTLKGILWHQGEGDSKPGEAEKYAARLHDLIARFRKTLEAPDVPFIAGQMGQFEERPWDESKKLVDAAHQTLPEKVPNTAFVSSEGLSHKGDEVHFDAASYREFGRRYARAHQNLTSKTSAAVGESPFEIDLNVARSGFDGETCWVHPRAGAIPPHARGNDSDLPLVVMTMQKLLLTGSDVFYALNEMRTEDLGRTWTGPFEHQSFARQKMDDGREVTVCDFTPKWHAATGKLLGTGQTVWYENNRVMHVRPRATAYAVYDSVTHAWAPWKRLQMPDDPKFQNAGAGSVQRLDLDNGDILIPIYFKRPEEKQYSVAVCRCRFDGETLSYLERGNEMTVPVERGLAEPSLAKFEDRYYLTLRNDKSGYVTVSDDGLNYGPPQKWTFDDGAELGNYNTQQHWVTHPDHGLFLVYTRRGASNDHVFRHRAPLFIARVDPHSLRVVRSTEQILVPEHGARLGNFAIAEVSPSETWVTVAEWMQPAGVEKYGSDNRVYVAKLKWRNAGE
jgi:hypothetical protein